MAGLIAALGLTRPGLVGLVGGGGKTTLLWALAAELAAASQPVVVTTTTHIHPPLARQAAGLWLWGADIPAPTALDQRLSRPGPLCLAAARQATGQLHGLSTAQIDALLARPGLWLLCEADGAAGRPLKAWASHEPALTGREAAIIVLVGGSGLGRPLHPDHVHRPQIMAQALGLAPGQPIPPPALAAYLAGPSGPLRQAAPNAQKILFLGQADQTSPAQRHAFLQAAAQTRRFDRLLWGSPANHRLSPWWG